MPTSGEPVVTEISVTYSVGVSASIDETVRRTGTSVGPNTSRYTAPVTTSATPTGAGSKNAIGSSPRRAISPETSSVEDVPTTVHVPPTIAAYESGNRSREGALRSVAARPSTTGMNTATTGVLFTNIDGSATSTTSAARQRRSLPRDSRRRRRPMRSTAPHSTRARDSTNIAATVRTAGFPKPPNASPGVSTPQIPSVSGISRATMSADTHSVTNRVRESASTISVAV